MDNKTYLINDNRSSTAFLMYASEPNGYKVFMRDLLNGTIRGQDYTVSNLFQTNSEYLVKILYFPMDLRRVLYGNFTTSTTIGLGKLDCNYTAYEITRQKVVKLFSLNITRKYNNFLDFSPYTKIKLYVPYFPLIEIDPMKVYGYTLNGYICVDVWTGKMGLYIENEDSNQNVNLLYMNTVNVGISIPMGKTNAEEIERNNLLNLISFIGGATALGLGALSDNPVSITAGVGMVTRSTTKAIADNVKHLTYSGADGSRCEYVVDKVMKLIIETPKDITVPNVALKGGVCKQNLSLSTVTGYTEIGEIHFNPMGYDIYDDEIAELNDLLRSGVIL